MKRVFAGTLLAASLLMTQTTHVKRSAPTPRTTSWQEVWHGGEGRQLNVVYRNETGVDVLVSVMMGLSPGDGYLVFTDDTSEPTTVVGGSVFPGGTTTFKVLPGDYYEVQGTGHAVVVAWTEWWDE